MSFALRAPELAVDFPSRIEWEETACLLCGGQDWSPLAEAPDPDPDGTGRWFMIVQCRDCGLCFTNPRPTTDSIAQFYHGEYQPHQPPSDSSGRIPWWHRLYPWARWHHGRRGLAMHGEGRLLDFGCGRDAFLLRMRQQGWNVVGVDTSYRVAHQLRDRLGLPILVGSLPHPELAPASFDVVTMWHSLEHTHQPFEVLQAAHELLAAGGRLIVSVPNIDSLAFRWFGQAWFPLDLPRHLVHFAPWTLRLMLHRAGFRQIRIRMLRRSSWLRHSSKRAGQLYPRVNWGRRALAGRVASNLASWYAYLTRQADCMVAEAIKK